MKKSIACLAALALGACSDSATPDGAGGASTANASGVSSASQSHASSGATTGHSSSASSGAGGALPSHTLIDLPFDSDPYGLAVDDAHIFWTNAGTGEVMQSDTDGNNQIALQIGEDFPIAVHVDSGLVYWLSYSIAGSIRSIPVGGGIVDTICDAPAGLDLVVDDTYVWWTREPDDVQRAPLVGLPPGVIDPFIVTGNPLSIGIAIDSSSVYWVNRQDGGVKRANHDLSGQRLLAIGDVSWGVTVDADNIYWTESGSGNDVGKVMQASKVDGTHPIEIASGLGRPKGLAVDADNIYWVESYSGKIQKAPIGGGAITELASGESEPLNIAVNSTSVFWTDRAGHHLGQVAK